MGYLFTLKDGEQVVVGARVGETESEIKVASAGGVETIVKKSDIDSVESLSASLMPEGLLQGLSDTEVRDLMTFLLKDEG